MIQSTASGRRFLAALALFGIAAGLAPQAKAYTPESPEVTRIVSRAVEYIETNYADDGDGYYEMLGGTCLVGMAVYKQSHDPSHRLVQAAVAKCEAVCRAGVPWATESNYSVGLAVIFLCELDAQRYRRQIEVLVEALFKRQQASGGWSYSDHQTGDTSQTQYGALGYWMVQRHGINVPTDKTERLCNWLIRTQTPKGNWGYQGKDPGNYNRIAQTEETMACAAAGLGSAYVCAELLGFIDSSDKKQDPDIPAALRHVGEAANKKSPITDKVAAPMLGRCLNDGNKFFDSHPNMMVDPQYQHYYMYALERYMSFRGAAEGSMEAEPDWYNWGVDYLGRTQAGNGSWRSCEAGPVIDSSFAVLFLLRSTQGTIERLEERRGTLIGGRGIPPVVKPVYSARVILPILEGGDLEELGSFTPMKLELSTNPQKRAGELVRLRRLVISGAYRSRLTAVKTIARDRDLDNFPYLIHALSDPDYRVVKAAQNGLRYISRRVDGFGLKVGDQRPSRPQFVAAQDKWKSWYRSLRPDAALIE